MGMICACGRCAHRFEVASSEGDEIGAVRCPECSFELCYHVGAGPTDDAHRLDDSVDAKADRQEHPVSSAHRSDVTLDPAPAKVQAPVAGASLPKRAIQIGGKVAVALAMILLLVGVGILIGRQRAIRESDPGVAEELGARGEPNLSFDQLVPADVNEAKTARTLEEAKNAIVKFVIPLGIGNLSRHGTGFLINDRGWVVTNNHVLASATVDARIKLADGRLVEIEGIIARSPDRDLAIVQLQETPTGLMLLDIGFDGQIPLGHEVYAFGHPYDAEFSLSKGIVSRNLTTADWLSNTPSHLLTKFNFPDDMNWIQHDAKISPGNSGGPLMDAQARVFGLNTFVHAKAEFGYACHVEYLREFVDSASGDIEPLPASRKDRQTTVSTAKIQELSRRADELRWSPRRAEEYQVLAELAQQMTIAKYASLEHNQPTGGKPHVTHRVAAIADEQFLGLKRRTWTSSQTNAIRSFAAAALTDLGGGFVAPCSFIANLDDQRSWVVRIDGTSELLMLRGGKQYSPAPRNTKCLVLGFVLPELVNVKIQNQRRTVEQQAPVILMGYVITFPR